MSRCSTRCACTPVAGGPTCAPTRGAARRPGRRCRRRPSRAARAGWPRRPCSPAAPRCPAARPWSPRFARGKARAAMDGGVAHRQAELATRVAAGATVEEIRAESVQLFRTALRRAADPSTPLDPATAARLLLGVRDVRVRDEVVTWAERSAASGDALRSLLTDLVRRAGPDTVAAPATMLAWVAYQQGDGAFAWIALERALAADPGYRLALLLDTLLRNGVHPPALRARAEAPPPTA